MDAARANHFEEQENLDEEDTQKLQVIKIASITLTNEAIDTLETTSLAEPRTHSIDLLNTAKTAATTSNEQEQSLIETLGTVKTTSLAGLEPIETVLTQKLPGAQSQEVGLLSRGRAAVLASLLFVVIVHTMMLGPTQFLGSQGWAYVLGGTPPNGNQNLLNDIRNQIKHGPTPGPTAPAMTPEQYINLIVSKMSLAEKLGQMMIVQFTGPTYSVALDTMLRQYFVGSVLIFSANGNIVDKSQLTSLTQQMQASIPAGIPLAIAIDQEGGRVDRLVTLDGPRPSATQIGATKDPAKARAAGMQDAQDLSSYGINLNLAPVVDVTTVYNPQMYDRTFGTDAATVTKFASAYLQGLQQSGKVAGTLKHFPGLGDVSADPHNSVPYLTRSQSNLEAIDWVPYRRLIQQGNVYAVMVTHEIVTALDTSKPSSLSYKIVTGILRDQLGFQGVVMTDSLTMEGIVAYANEAQAAVLAVEAGDDLLMGASTPSDVAMMIEGLNQAMKAGEIMEQRIDDSVRRILMLKYYMGLLPVPAV